MGTKKGDFRKIDNICPGFEVNVILSENKMEPYKHRIWEMYAEPLVFTFSYHFMNPIFSEIADFVILPVKAH